MESAFGMSVGSTSALPLGYYLTLAALLQLSESRLPSLTSNDASLAAWPRGSDQCPQSACNNDAHTVRT